MPKKTAKKTVRKKTIKKKAKKTKKNAGGRPCLLDDKNIYDRLIDLVLSGNYYCVACAACDIAYQTFNLWMQEGKRLAKDYLNNEDKIPKSKRKFFEFFYAIKKAEALVETDIVSKLLSDKDWKAQMTYLERKYPDRWGRTERHKVEGELKINVAKLTDQELSDVINDKYIEKK